MDKAGLWFSTYYGEYDSSDPAFYPAADIDVAAYLEANYIPIRDELKHLWAEGNDTMDKYGDYTAYDDVQFPPGGWKKLVLKTWGLDNKYMWRKLPVTASLLTKFPDITNCFITKLARHTNLRLHHGETNATYRIHLGLKVPEVPISDCGFEVKGEEIKWQNGKAWGFIDAHSHRAWNNSDEDRYVLLIDVIRPEFRNKKNYVCAKVIISHIVSGLGRRLHFHRIYKKGWPFGGLVFAILYIPILIGIKINNTFGILRF